MQLIFFAPCCREDNILTQEKSITLVPIISIPLSIQRPLYSCSRLSWIKILNKTGRKTLIKIKKGRKLSHSHFLTEEHQSLNAPESCLCNKHLCLWHSEEDKGEKMTHLCHGRFYFKMDCLWVQSHETCLQYFHYSLPVHLVQSLNFTSNRTSKDTCN